MKSIKNSPLVGRVEDGKPIEFNVDAKTMTATVLIRWALREGLPEKQNTIANQRRVGELLDALEPQYDEPYYELGDTDWDFIRPLVESKALMAFQRHAPVVMDELDARINRGMPIGSLPEEDALVAAVAASTDGNRK
jgi:hypothetical protein